jgi:hypothetical protein
VATKYPIYFDRVRLLINPESIDVQKTSNVAETRTLKGTVFQFWPDLPDVINFHGRVLGAKAYTELKFLQQHFEKEGKECTMLYKTREYQGFFMNFKVDAESDMPGKFKYVFDFKIMGPHFEDRDLALGFVSTVPDEFSAVANEFQEIWNKLKNINIRL